MNNAEDELRKLAWNILQELDKKYDNGFGTNEADYLELKLREVRAKAFEEAAKILEIHCDEQMGIHIKSVCILCRTAKAIREKGAGK